MAPAHTLSWLVRWAVLSAACALGAGLPGLAPMTPPPCPMHCICLSQSQDTASEDTNSCPPSPTCSGSTGTTGSHSIAEKIDAAKQIVNETYCIPSIAVNRKTIPARGKLVDRYNNQRRVLKKEGVIHRKRKLEEKLDSMVEETIITENEDQVTWLKYHKEPYQEVREKWLSTRAFRVEKDYNNKNKQLREILQKYPILKQNFGYKLMLKYLSIILSLLCGKLKPSVGRGRGATSKKKSKPSVLEARDNLLLHIKVVCNSANLRGVPSALSPAVTQLSLSRADLRVLRSDAFAHLRALRRLALDACNLTRIRPFAFRGLPRLRELYIQHTPLATVDAFAFAALQNITSIILTHNRIAQIEGYAFAGTNFIRLISLRNNPIRKILAHAFSGLNDVAQIELPSGIRSIEPQAFAGLESVGVLELAYMDLPALLPDTFRGLTRVGKLALRESDLGIIRVGAFDGLQRVDALEMCNNKIDRIEELSLVQNNSVRMFKLTGNHMLETPESVMLEVDSLVIRGNHLPCECGRDPLANPLALTQGFAEENFCISPLKVRGRSLGSAAGAACRGEAGGSARARAAAGAGAQRCLALPHLALAITSFAFLANS